ncbi:hypothetical protein [Dryocola clanedunensis]|nr:hypothetical protein [Cedecea sulfonylureivorans]
MHYDRSSRFAWLASSENDVCDDFKMMVILTQAIYGDDDQIVPFDF